MCQDMDALNLHPLKGEGGNRKGIWYENHFDRG
jgi:hypothetical protein